MSIGWMVSIVALWIVVILETGLLLLLLRALGEIKQKGMFSFEDYMKAATNIGLPIGEQAPSFAARDLEGNIVKLEDFQGQRRVLTFISPGCTDCRIAIEALNAIQQDKNHPVLLVLGSLDIESNRMYATQLNAQMPVLTPKKGLDSDVYRVQTVPFSFVVDEQGVIRAKGSVTQIERLQELLETAFPSTAITH